MTVGELIELLSLEEQDKPVYFREVGELTEIENVFAYKRRVVLND